MILRLYPLFLAMLMLLLSPYSGEARPEYAQEQQKKCKACHVRNGNGALSDEGKNFRKSLYTQKGVTPPAEQKNRQQTTVKEEQETEQPPAKKERLRKKPKKPVEVEEEDDGDEEEEAADEKPEPPKTVIYRWQGKDGSMVFAEHPAAPADKQKKPDVKKSRKTAAPVKTARVEKKQTVAAKPSAALKPAPAQQEARAVVKQTFPECMEAELADQPEPTTSDELMNILVEARSRCSVYEK